MRPSPLPLVFLAIAVAVAPASAQRIKLSQKLSELEARARADSNDAVAHYNLALGYWSEERYDDAERSLRQALDLTPRFAEAWLALAHLPYARRPELWDEVQEVDVPAEWTAVVEESDRYYQRAFLSNPLVDLKIIGAVLPARSVYWHVNEGLRRIWDEFFQGFEEVFHGNYERAYGRLDRLVHRFGSGDRKRISSSLLWYRGLAAAKIGRFDDAIADMQALLDRSLAEERKDSLLHVPLATNDYRYVLAVLHQRAERLGEAEGLYLEALQRDIGLYMAHVQLCGIHQNRRDWRAAILECQRAVHANPDDPTLLVDLGYVQGRAGYLSDAETTLLRAIELHPRDARARYILGLVQFNLEKTAEAKSCLEQFLAMAPSRWTAEIADAEHRLEMLR